MATFPTNPRLVVNGTTYNLPPVKAEGYSVTGQVRGGVREMSDGATVIDIVATGKKRRFKLSWIMLTNAEYATLENAWYALQSGNGTFRAPTYYYNTQEYVVTLDKSSTDLQSESRGVPDGSGGVDLRWSASLNLREV